MVVSLSLRFVDSGISGMVWLVFRQTRYVANGKNHSSLAFSRSLGEFLQCAVKSGMKRRR
jgi:hypothetical protein